MKKHHNIDFGTEVSRIHPLIMRKLAKRQMSVFSKGLLTIPQIVILDLLAEKGSCKMNELARVLNFTMSAVTAIVDKMVKLKLVRREHSTEDRRVVRVTMLEKGREIVRRVSEERRDAANSIFAPLTEKDKKEYLRILRKVYDNLIEQADER